MFMLIGPKDAEGSLRCQIHGEAVGFLPSAPPGGFVQEISAGKKGIDFEAFAKHVRKDEAVGGKDPFMRSVGKMNYIKII